MKKVVLFGAGLVSRPLVRYLLDHGIGVVVASRTVSKAEALVQGYELAEAVALDVSNDAAMRKLIKAADLTVSLLPAPKHPQVARACLDLGKHMVTTSYINPAMTAFDAEAKEKGLTLLNEIGVDPGIDHMSAMEIIHREQDVGGTLIGFSSWCGGLPAPEANDNPFGYKFSWAPRGVLVAAQNPARYLKNDKLIEIPGEKLFADPASVEIPDLGTFEGYPNRDSVSYLDTYGWSKDEVKNIFRGTLRNQGHCVLYMQLIALGLLEQEPAQNLEGKNYRQLMETRFGAPLEETIPAKLGVDKAASPLTALAAIHMTSEDAIRVPKSGTAMVDIMADRMADDLAYKAGERDMLVMRHDIDFDYEDGKKSRVTAIMVDFGIPNGDSTMARTVSLPAAIGARMILEDKITARGVHLPIAKNIYQPVLKELVALGITFTETKKDI